MIFFFFSLTACMHDLDTSSFQELEPYLIGEEEEVADPNRYLDPLIVDWIAIEDSWLGEDEALPSKEENLQAYELLLSVYVEEFLPRTEQYRSKNSLLTLEVEYLFGHVLRTMKRKNRLSIKSRKKHLSKLKIKIDALLSL